MIYINVVCDGGCKKAVPLFFDLPDETWELMCGFLEYNGWLLVGHKHRRKYDPHTMNTYCPDCRKQMDEIENLELM